MGELGHLVATAVQLGLSGLVWPLAVRVPLAMVLAIGAGLLVIRMARARLRDAGRAVGLATLALGVVQLGLLPLYLAYAVTSFTVQRALADALEQGGPAVLELALNAGGKAAEARLGLRGDETALDVGALRARVRGALRSLAGPSPTEGDTVVAAGIAQVLRRAMQTSYVEGLDRALAGIGGRIAWRDLAERARAAIDAAARRALGRLAEPLRAGGRAALTTGIVVVLLGNALCYAIVALVCRRRPAAP